jgi:outer membrane protein assembly factor BamB
VAIIVNCPACGTPASIEPNFYGKKLRCANQDCRQAFRVQSDGSVSMEGGGGPGRAETAKSYDWQNPPAQEAQEGDWLAAPPPMPGQAPMANVIQQPMAQVVPMGQVITAGGDDDEEEGGYTPGDYSYGANKKKGKFLIILIGLVVLLIGGLGFGYWLLKQRGVAEIAAIKKKLDGAMDKKTWDEVATLAKSFLDKKKEARDNTDVKEVEMDLTWAELQLNLRSNQLESLAGIRKAMTSVQDFYKAKRGDTTLYPRFRKDFVESAFGLVGKASDFLEANPDVTLHDDLRPVLDLAIEAGRAVQDTDSVAAWQADATKKHTNARIAIDAGLAKKNWVAKLQDVLAKQKLGDVDSIQNDFLEIAKKHDRLNADAEIKGMLQQLRQAEPNWVKYNAISNAPTPNKTSFGPSIRICPPVKTVDGVQDDSGIVLAMARGTLYGLSARTGKDRWALRVGQDVRELPPRISLGGEAPDIAFVITTEEANQTYLSQMNLVTGERNWMRKLPSACPAGPLLISNNRLAVPLKESVAIIEAGSGKQTGIFTISGYNLSSQPAHDRLRDRLFVPVDRSRIFVLDLATRKCVNVIYTEHGSGQIKGAPLIIDDLMVVCIASGSGAGSTRILAFDISQKGDNPTFDSLGSYDMPGHASTSPYVDGNETLGIVSDQGLLWLFGIGKSSSGGTTAGKGNTPFYPLTAKPMPMKIQANAELKKDQPRPRVQVAHVSLSDWWVFTHDHLVRNVYDPFRGVMYPSPLGSLPLGSPLHRAEVSPDGRMVTVVTQPKGQAQMLASGLDRSTGKVVWQTQLGTEASQDPVALADSVAMIDRGGAVFSVKSEDVGDKASWQVVGTWPALPLVAASHRLVKSPSGKCLVSLSFNPTLIRMMENAGASKAVTREFPHTFAPVGTPVVLDDGTTLVPCKDGNIYQFNFAAGTSNSLFSWRDPTAFSNAVGHLLMPGPNTLLATNGMNKVLRWERNAQGVWKKTAMDMELTARLITPMVVLPGNRVAVGDDAGNLHSLALAALGTSKQWPVKGTITRGPFKIGNDGVGCIVDGKRLWWIASGDDEEGKVFANDDIAMVIGQATMIGDDILLAVLKRDAGLGMLANYLWVDPSTGKVIHTEQLPEGLAPSSGATALGKNRAFAPLSDGTVRILLKPESTTAATRN